MDLSNKGLTLLPTGKSVEVGNFNCSKNKLTNLIGAPKEVNGFFDCSRNNLTNLIGSPNYISEFFNCRFNNLTNLVGAPKYIGSWFSIRDNLNLLDVSDIWNSDIESEIYFDLNLGMAILPLIKFEGLRCENGKLESIHARNRGGSKQNIIDFQYDLMENGFEDNARWKPGT